MIEKRIKQRKRKVKIALSPAELLDHEGLAGLRFSFLGNIRHRALSLAEQLRKLGNGVHAQEVLLLTVDCYKQAYEEAEKVRIAQISDRVAATVRSALDNFIARADNTIIKTLQHQTHLALALTRTARHPWWKWRNKE